MKFDCSFTKSDNWFRYRTGAILIKDNKMLLVKSKIGNYFYMIGGGVHIGETSKECIERELFEEAGVRASAKYLAVVCENFFKGEGGNIDTLNCHVIEFYYRMTSNDMTSINSQTDDGEELVWVPLDKIKDTNIKPQFIKEHIDEIVNSKSIIHIVEERDR